VTFRKCDGTPQARDDRPKRSRRLIARDAHAEGAGGLDLGLPPPDGLEDLLLAHVFRVVGIHPSMVPYSPTPLQAAALGYVLWPCLTEDLKQEIEAVLLAEPRVD
jgi:hypothetical protein